MRTSLGRLRRATTRVGPAPGWRFSLLFFSLALALLIASARPVAAAPSSNTHQYPTAMYLSAAADFNHILRVPAEYPTIQAAVDTAASGDLVLVAPGTYSEAVKVKTSGITIRGEDRNRTILDGRSTLSDGFTVTADMVVIENMTAHHYVGNGFYWSGVDGYRGSYITAYDNGDYGIYAFASTHGEFNDSYASGSPDSGFYIGQCFPCHALIERVHSQYNALGYSGTNAGGNLILRDSEWDHNGAGILPNTLDSEEMPPEHGATVIYNHVHDNGTTQAPAFPLEHPGFGIGIGMPGGDFNYVAYNTVEHNATYGIAVTGNLDDNFWLASGNVIEHNTIRDSGSADLALSAPSGAGNCFANNAATTTAPAFLELTHACGTPLPLNGGGDIGVTETLLSRYVYASGPNYHSADYRTAPAPADQQGMPDTSAGPSPIFVDPFSPDDTSNGSLPAKVTFGGPAMLEPLGFTSYSIVQILLSFYGNLILFALYAAWLAVAFVELSQRDDLGTGKRLAWGALAVGIPLLGPIVYYVAGSKLTPRFRLALVAGAPLLSLIVTIALMVVASYTL